ncbi:MAG: S-layer homology domain-containing protein [Firmicutes bacterium]|nr:S-layer homology domain-containing protein [Bacillota bacterium]
MIKRWLAVLLVLTLVVSSGTGVYAARDTDYFAEQYHGDVAYEDMAYEPVDMDEERDYMDRIREAAQDEANIKAVNKGAQSIVSDVTWMVTMRELCYVKMCRNTRDASAREDYQEASRIVKELFEEYTLLTGDLLRSPCGSIYDGVLSEEDREYYLNYEARSEEEIADTNRLTELEADFWEADGKVYSSAKEENAAKGPIFLEMLKLRRDQAKDAGYGSYADYAYEELYLRDYTTEDAAEFAREAREYVLPLFNDVTRICRAERYRDVLSMIYSGDAMLDMMLPWVEVLSDELAESFAYMRDYGLYAIGSGGGMSNQGYTIMLPTYHEPFLYNYTNGNILDLSATIHEFGHFNDMYWSDPDGDMSEANLDIAEVPSQALELLFTEYYPALFGEDDGKAVSMEVLRSILWSVVDAARQDEFLQWVFDQKNPSLQEINEAYGRISARYGYDDEDEKYLWVKYSHSFESPFYYISYGTSAAGALELWARSREEYLSGVNDYLRFTALDEGMGFKESFEALGMDSPLDRGALKEMAEYLREELEIDRLLPELPAVGYFKDVKERDWYRDAVAYVFENDLMNGLSRTVFAPNGEMTQAQLVTILYRFEDGEDGADPAGFSDVEAGSWYEDAVNWAAENGIVNGLSRTRFGPGEKVTREQMAAILYRSRGGTGADGEAIEAYADAGEVSAWALDAMNWCIGKGIITGTSADRLSPAGTTTRAQAATILMRLKDL